MKCNNWNIAVCSWSLQKSIPEVAEVMKKLGLTHIHLATRPAIGEDGQTYLDAVAANNWTISCTMIDFPQEDYSTLENIKRTGGILPDDCWVTNKADVEKAIKVTADLGVKYLSFHAGFIDHNQPESYKVMCDRIKALADVAADCGVMILLETGQESAADLRDFMKDVDHSAVGINFDPANMILYDKGDPIEAVGILAPWIKHVHIKDGNRSETPGEWGAEVPWGDGQVNSAAFLQALKDINYEGVIAIEREAGDDRAGDIGLAVERLSS